MALLLHELNNHRSAVEGGLEIISDPEKWGKGGLAIDDAGMPVDWRSRNACRWCAIGAVYKSIGRDPMAFEGIIWGIKYLSLALSDSDEKMTISRFNDLESTKQEDVIALFQRALALIDEDIKEYNSELPW